MKKLKLSFKDDGFIPNSRFPVILTFGHMVNLRAKNVVEAEVEANLKNRALKTGWNLEWLWKVYKRPHYHSTTHEALVVYRGWANLWLGGHRLGKVMLVSPGDTIVIPAGVAHQAVDRTRLPSLRFVSDGSQTLGHALLQEARKSNCSPKPGSARSATGLQIVVQKTRPQVTER